MISYCFFNLDLSENHIIDFRGLGQNGIGLFQIKMGKMTIFKISALLTGSFQNR